MKRSISLLVIFISLIISSCTTDIPVSPNKDSQQGGISLNIDRVHKPDNVISVTAYLTREGFDSLSGTLNLITDTTADITFNDISAGGWHLKIDAADEDTVVVYSGETDVTILAGITTQVSLVLQPTGAGKGNIYIYVTWGVPQNTNWIDYPNNPIMSPQYNYWDYDGVSQGKILFDGGTYKMWYLGLAGGGVAHVGYAESTDGISWTRPYSDPVLSPGNYNDWDAGSVAPGVVIKEDGVYKMYYVGWRDQNLNWSIGLATSSDGINWTKYSNNPVLYGTAGWEYQIAATSLLKINNTYYLYYFGRNFPEYKIGLATSTDGINWSKYSGNPILIQTESWELTGVYNPTVIEDNGTYKMIYSNAAPNTAFGMATSTDGVNWSKSINNPIVKKQNTSNNWGAGGIGYPFLMKFNNEYRLYYSGKIENSEVYRMGFTSKVIN